jgi:hypothetical protein
VHPNPGLLGLRESVTIRHNDPASARMHDGREHLFMHVDTWSRGSTAVTRDGTQPQSAPTIRHSEAPVGAIAVSPTADGGIQATRAKNASIKRPNLSNAAVEVRVATWTSLAATLVWLTVNARFLTTSDNDEAEAAASRMF